ncbi:hypothetical protein F66182_5894 [Fusarium sp. NRRL 66182]|nr:hypothetical protein F66182_5894 [Fusarium sp. NRRL 66182]
MDLCITAQEPFAYEPPKTKPFVPVSGSTSPRKTSTPHLVTTSASPAPLSAETVSELEFSLIVHDPSQDSSLTHPWDLPETPLRISLDTSRVQLLTLLRAQLPIPSTSKSKSRRARRPKLISATMYWTYGGSIIPLGASDTKWHYVKPITKTDIMERTELEWFLLKEMMASSGGALKCYFAIRGEAMPKRSTGWWFGSSA